MYDTWASAFFGQLDMSIGLLYNSLCEWETKNSYKESSNFLAFRNSDVTLHHCELTIRFV